MTTRLFVAGCLVLSMAAQASGFRLNGQSAQAEGMGLAVTALTDDATAIYYNPAGISGRKGFEVSAGINLIIPTVTFASDNTGQSTTTKPSVSPPFTVYATLGITDDLTIGLGIFTPFGAGNTWPSGWEGAGRAVTSNVQTFDFNPTISWRVHPRFKIGAGLQLVRGTVQIGRELNFLGSTGTVSLGGDAFGLGWNAGFQVELVEKYLWLGATWRSSVGLAFNGNAHFGNIPAEFQSLLADQTIHSDIRLPDVMTVGFGYRATSSLRFGADLNIVTWDSFHDLTIAFNNPQLTNPLAKNWTTTVSYHVGAEYDVSKAFQARLGFIYDPTGSPTNTLTPDLPDFNRFEVCVGAGWRSDFGLRVDLSYNYVALFSQRSTAPGFAGTYSGNASVIGLQVGYRL